MFTKLTSSRCAVTPRFLLLAVLVLTIVLVGTPAWAVETFKLQWAALETYIVPMWSDGTTTETLEPWTEPVPGGASGYHLSFHNLYFLCSGLGTNQETCEVAPAYTDGTLSGSMVITRNYQTLGDAIFELNLKHERPPISGVIIGLGTKEIVPLQVFITQPKTGATVSGTLWVVMWVEGTSGAPNVFTLSVDGKQVGSQTTSSRGPVTIPWVTKPVGATPVPNGTHTLTGTVRDATGNTGTTSISVILRN